MPLYDYECLSCGHIFELRQSFKDEPTGVCPRCEGLSRRKFHAVPVIYKGSGFYTTDYRSDSYKAGAKKDGGESKPSEKKTDSAASKDTKSSGSKKAGDE